MKINIEKLKEYVHKEGLKLIKEESVNLDKLEDVLHDIDEGLIDRYEDRLSKLKSEEKDAFENEDYSNLKKVKSEQLEIVEKLIKFYEKKSKILTQIGEEIKTESEKITSKGIEVFGNKSMDEFKNEDILQGTKLKINGSSKYFTIEKVNENNNYIVLSSNIQGVEEGDYLKISDMKIGGSGEITVYRKMGDRFDELKTLKLKNVTDIVKNPM